MKRLLLFVAAFVAIPQPLRKVRSQIILTPGWNVLTHLHVRVWEETHVK